MDHARVGPFGLRGVVVDDDEEPVAFLVEVEQLGLEGVVDLITELRLERRVLHRELPEPLPAEGDQQVLVIDPKWAGDPRDEEG